MSEEVLASYIKQLIELEPSNEVTVALQVVNPLLRRRFLSEGCRNCLKVPRDKHIHWTMQTNGTLLNEEWCDFFRKNNYLVGLSLDGPQEIHDAYRVDNQGKGTFDKVMAAADLLKRCGVEFNVLCCVHRASKNGLEIYRFLRDQVGARYIQFIPVVERQNLHEWKCNCDCSVGRAAAVGAIPN